MSPWETFAVRAPVLTGGDSLDGQPRAIHTFGVDLAGLGLGVPVDRYNVVLWGHRQREQR